MSKPSQGKCIIRSAAFALTLILGGTAVLQPNRIVAAIAKHSPQVVYFVETEEPVVALTIDDGPDPVTTPKILDVLARYDAHATFFLISDRVAGNEEIVTRTVEEDHEIANHLTADEPSILLPVEQFEDKLLAAHDVLSQFSDVHWLRPGSGWYNDEMLSVVHKHGYQCALGSIYPFDSHLPSAWFSTQYILSNVRPGSIIILHDRGARGERTATALATILPELEERGFCIVTLSELVSKES